MARTKAEIDGALLSEIMSMAAATGGMRPSCSTCGTAAEQLTNYIFRYRNVPNDADITGSSCISYAACSACHTPFDIKGKARHGDIYRCPVCGRDGIIYDAARGHNKCYQEAYITELRRIDARTLIEIGYYIELDQGGGCAAPQDAEPMLIPIAITLAQAGDGKRAGRAAMFRRDVKKEVRTYVSWAASGYYSEYRVIGEYASDLRGGWKRCRKIAPGNHYKCMFFKLIGEDADAYMEKMNGTRFAAALDAIDAHHGYYDMLYYTDIALDRRIELLARAGFKRMALDLLNGQNCVLGASGSLTIAKRLGLDGGQMAELKRDGELRAKYGISAHKALHALSDAGVRISVADAVRIKDNSSIISFIAQNIFAPALRRKAVRYVLRHIGDKGRSDIYMLYDYWRMAHANGEDVNSEDILLPAWGRLQAAHDREMVREKYIKNDIYDTQIAKRLKELTRDYAISFGRLTLKPFGSSKEIIDEGALQHNCVGGYCGAYAQGTTIICTLRICDEPDKPYRTVEISRDGTRLIQCRGRHNDSPDAEQPEIDAFWKTYWEWRAENANERNNENERIRTGAGGIACT